MNYGFIPDVIEPDNYLFGSDQLSTKIIRSTGDWSDALPKKELQHNNHLETVNCTSYGTLNAIETLMKAQFDEDVDYSDRFTGILANTTTRGNTPHKVAESIRHKGVIDDKLLPFSPDIKTWGEYYAPKPMDCDLKFKAIQWHRKYDFGHDWVQMGSNIENNRNIMLSALLSSPLGVAVNAWNKEGDIYIKKGPDNHWCLLFKASWGKYWWIFDTYDATIKKLDWNYPFEFVKRYTIETKTYNPNWIVDLYLRFQLLWKK